MCKINSINLDYFFLKLDNGVGKKDFIDYFSIIDTFAPTGRYKIMLFPSSLLLNGMHLYPSKIRADTRLHTYDQQYLSTFFSVLLH